LVLRWMTFLLHIKRRGASPITTAQIRQFEEQFRHESKADKAERICNEVASAGLFVSDAAGGPGNLRLPHKQFYEFLIAKASWELISNGKHRILNSFLRINNDKFLPMTKEDQSILLFLEFICYDFACFRETLYVISFLPSFIREQSKEMTTQFSVLFWMYVLLVMLFVPTLWHNNNPSSTAMNVVDSREVIAMAMVAISAMLTAFLGLITISYGARTCVFTRVVAYKLGRVSRFRLAWECFLILIGSAHSVILQRAKADHGGEEARSASLSSS
jgi:hypothetical protein